MLLRFNNKFSFKYHGCINNIHCIRERKDKKIQTFTFFFSKLSQFIDILQYEIYDSEFQRLKLAKLTASNTIELYKPMAGIFILNFYKIDFEIEIK